MQSLEEWWEAGERIALEVGGAERRVFVRRLGEGPLITILHGFPSSSHDWAAVAPLLLARHTVLAPDFLGFGASEKPAPHEYSLHEQADLVEALWAHEGVSETVVVAHDYAVSVAQELLARREERGLAAELRSLHLLNGGLYPALHRAQPIQRALLDPEQGPLLSAQLNEQAFVAGLAATFSDSYDSGPDRANMWRSTSREGGQRIAHLLIRYISDRERHAQRWVGALERADVPLSFIWGMLDPVSGAHMAERIRERLGGARTLELDDVSHWPPLEAPDRVARALLDG